MNPELSRVAEEAKKIVTWYDGESSRKLVDSLLGEQEVGILTLERITSYLKGLDGSIAPALYFLLRTNIVKKDRLYEVFVPMFKIGENPLDPVFIRYVVGMLLLDWKFFTKAQARHFINGLIENSDIEEIYKNKKIIAETAVFPDAFIDESPVDDYTLRTDFGDSDEEKEPQDDFEIIENPTKEQAKKAAVNMLYGGSDTFYDNVDSYLGDRW